MSAPSLRRLLLAVLQAGLLLALAAAPTTLAQSGRADLGRLDAYFEQARASWNVPGLAVAIVKDDRLVLARG